MRMSPEKEVAIRAAAEANHDALLKAHPWIAPSVLNKRVASVMRESISNVGRHRKLIQIVDAAAAAIQPHTPCGKGCSHCCKTAVIISGMDARTIAWATGLRAHQVPIRHPDEIRPLKETYLGQACPFLKNDACSIYEARPYACRQQHSLNADASQCDTTAVNSEDSMVMHFNLKYLELAVVHTALRAQEPLGDIREFFGEAPVEL